MKTKFIQLTSRTSIKLYINVNMIGDISDRVEIIHENSVLIEKKYTNVGVLTHNNGGFNVIETAEEILNLINN